MTATPKQIVIPQQVLAKTQREFQKGGIEEEFRYVALRYYFLYLEGRTENQSGTLITPEFIRQCALAHMADMYQTGLQLAGDQAPKVRKKVAQTVARNPLDDIVETVAIIAAGYLTENQIADMWQKISTDPGHKSFGRKHFNWSIHYLETPARVYMRCIANTLVHNPTLACATPRIPVWAFAQNLDDKIWFRILIEYILEYGQAAKVWLADKTVTYRPFTKPWQLEIIQSLLQKR